MAKKKKPQTSTRSAKSVGATGKKAVAKTSAAAKSQGRSATKSKPAARKPAAPARAAAKVKKPAAKTAGTAAAVKPSSSKTAAKPASAKTAAKTPVKAKAKTAAKPQAKAAAKAQAKPQAKTQAKLNIAARIASRQAAAAAAPARAVAAAVKPAGQKITAPVAPAAPKSAAEKTAAARQIANAQKKPVSQRHGFKASEFIVYPAHGVGKIIGIEEQEIAGMALELFVINFEKEKLTLRVPTGKLESVGMRKLSDDAVVKKAMETLKGRARVKRTMWSRRAQEYVAKINSGDLVSIAEVVRDLYRSEAQPEQSYSERQLYEDALDRMSRELAAVEKLDERGAVQRITDVLSKSARGRRAAAEGEGGDAETKAA
jgi:CarD family transcriptional regulator, regulator of rRNA transcription